jgi:hypothetical protein
VLAAIRSGSLPNPWTVADCRVDPADAASPTRIYFGCDGVMAPWNRLQVKSQSLPLDALGLDFDHLAENVHKARRIVYGETA